jgi:hypothetical protein
MAHAGPSETKARSSSRSRSNVAGHARNTTSNSRYGASISSDGSSDGSVEDYNDPVDDAMDLDTPPKVPTPEDQIKPARSVRQPVSRSDWSHTVPVTESPSEVPLSQDNIPSAVPNAAYPPTSANLPRSAGQAKPPTAANIHTPRRASEQSIPASFNLSGIKDNLDPGGVGVSNLDDIKNSLPFNSRPSNKHPSTLLSSTPSGDALELPKLNLPKPPVYPAPPFAYRRFTAAQWRSYLQQFSLYMGLWYQFEEQILNHINARHYDSRKFGTGMADVTATRLLDAQGEPAGGGLEAYLQGHKQDQRVQLVWIHAQEKHYKSVEEFVKIKAKIQAEGFSSG